MSKKKKPIVLSRRVKKAEPAPVPMTEVKQWKLILAAALAGQRLNDIGLDAESTERAINRLFEGWVVVTRDTKKGPKTIYSAPEVSLGNVMVNLKP